MDKLSLRALLLQFKWFRSSLMKCPGSVVQTGLQSVALLVKSWPVCSTYSLRVLGDLGLVSKKLNEFFPPKSDV